jgi:phosphinothricin acetyltransferase
MPTILAMQPADWPAVRRIYAEGMATGMATFDSEIPEWAEWSATHRADARLVARLDDRVVAWAALLPISSRSCYAGVAEVSIYVGIEARGRGVGRALLTALIAASEAAGIWTLHSSIHSDNSTSIALHQRAGFRLIGRREAIARRADGWADTVLMERRSRVNGVE